jgi:hypothetical protein
MAMAAMSAIIFFMGFSFGLPAQKAGQVGFV